ncbi:MAG: ADP-ribosylglycohydrolase family protein [Methanomassiliicoccales archaeon]|nr:ADP-ribosylglycohydrolase family protein [Methanomassiliicoccales archaeon]
MDSLKSKFIGCLVGTAIGDALGRRFEGHWLPETLDQGFTGRWTDDTHMMIGVAESLIEMKGFDGDHMARTFIRNYEYEPWRGYASGPPRVFKMIKSGMRWDEAARQLFGGVGSYGNGAAMRVAPVALLYHGDVEKLREVAYAQGSITHAHKLGIEGAALQAYAIALALRLSESTDFDPQCLILKLKEFTDEEVYRVKIERIRELLTGGTKAKIIRELGHGIEAFNSVPTAIFSFLANWKSFEDAVRYAVSLGGDADTIGAMTGAISGAYHGIERIPQRWRECVERREYIETLGEKLYELWALSNNSERFRFK